jgi:hypothetical protein
MREKNYSTGLRGVLFEAGHYERMGAAIWLYGWLVLRQTHQSGTVGWVLGGAPIHYREIEEETGFAPKTLERWMRTLREQGYIETQPTTRGLIVRILKAKKFAQRFPQASRKNGARATKSEAGPPQECGAQPAEIFSAQSVAERIGSSYIEESKTKSLLALISSEVRKQLERQNPQTFCLGKNKIRFRSAPPGSRTENLEGSLPSRSVDQSSSRPSEMTLTKREFFELMRAEREEAVRRELYVGTGPEVPRR